MALPQGRTRKGRRHKRCDIHPDSKLLAELTDQRSLRSLALIDLSAGKFPETCHLAARRALLEELQRHVDEYPAAPAAALAADAAGRSGETAWYVEPASGLRLGIPASCTALVGAGDRLLAVRAYGTPYVAVVRGGTVMAAIRGCLPAGDARPAAALPTIRRRYVQAVTRHRAESR